MKNINTIKILFHIFLLFAFLAGIYVCLTGGINNRVFEQTVETMDMGQLNPGATVANKQAVESCPDLLIKKGNSLMLYNTKMLEVEGVNPLPFDSLDDYIKYMDIQKKNGSQCPVLFLQQENDAQGKDVFRMRPSPFYVEGGLPPLPMKIHDNTVIQNIVDASRENPPYNANNHAGFDPYNYNIGRFSNIDQIHKSTMDAATDASGNKISENPMDSNWGGIPVTQRAVDSGKYAENEVRPVMYPKIAK
jgi:hypothetical protein